MFDDQKIQLIESMPEGDSILIIWIKLLVLAGKVNDGGLIYLSKNISYNEEMLSTVFRKPLPVIRMALKVLIDFGMIEDAKGGKMQVANWGKHQNIEGLEKVRKQNRLRQQNYRKKQKQKQIGIGSKSDINVTRNVTVTKNNGTEEERDIDKEECSTAQHIEIDSQIKVKDEILNQEIQADTVANRRKILDIIIRYTQSDDFKENWRFMSGRFSKKIKEMDVIEDWVKGADWFLVKNFQFNKIANWIKHADNKIKAEVIDNATKGNYKKSNLRTIDPTRKRI